MALIQTGKYLQHVTVRLSAPKIAVFNDFDGNLDNIEAALLGAERL